MSARIALWTLGAGRIIIPPDDFGADAGVGGQRSSGRAGRCGGLSTVRRRCRRDAGTGRDPDSRRRWSATTKTAKGRRHGAARVGNESDRSRRLPANASPLPRGRGRAADVRRARGPLDHPRGRSRDASATSIRTRPIRSTCFASTGSTTPHAAAWSATPGAIELSPELTGSPARIVLALGERFPMIRAHKVLAAYGCLAPRVVTGQFDPTRHRAIWPSTGNYCRGGVAISRILGCRGVAVLPENMSQERFDWLERWVAEPSDIVRTPGSESNVKEIYDACAALDRDPANIVFNQFCEFGNYLVHRLCTGAALERVFHAARRGSPARTARRFRLGDRIGGDDRRGRPSEERVRRAHRGGRGGRMPDPAHERLRRAQHPGHRRQARAADPQRDEHRRRRSASAITRPTRC